MGRTICDITISADGYSAGLNQTGEVKTCGSACHALLPAVLLPTQATVLPRPS
jgi:hypothetical protein